MKDDGAAQDPFYTEEPYGPSHQSLGDGELQWAALAQLPSFVAAVTAVKKMRRHDLESIALERLYTRQAEQMGPLSPQFQRWWNSEREPDSS